jgi:hypothetical protein
MQREEYGELMRFLLYFRERYQDDGAFRKFVLESLKELVYDLRDFGIYISINPASFKQGARAI